MDVVKNYFSFLEKALDVHKFRIILLGDFNVPGFDWGDGVFHEILHYNSFAKGSELFASTCYLTLNQINNTVPSKNLLDLIFSNFDDVSVHCATHPMVKEDNYHPSLTLQIALPFLSDNCNSSDRFLNYSLGDYDRLYNILYLKDWSCVLNQTNVDIAVEELYEAVTVAISQSIPYSLKNKQKFPSWFSSDLKFYIRKKNDHHRPYKKTKSGFHYDLFSYYRKLVKITIKADRRIWLSNINDNLKSNPKQFWKFVRNYRKNNSIPTHLLVNGSDVSDLHRDGRDAACQETLAFWGTRFVCRRFPLF